MTMNVDDERALKGSSKPICNVTWSFTTDAAGDASEQSETLNGRISRAVTNPDNTDTPTAGWDLTIEDEDGVDMLCGNGADRDASGSKASESAFPCPGNLAIASKLTFTVSNGGNVKKGTVKLYIV